MSQTGKSREAERRLLVTGGWGEEEGGVTANGTGILRGNENVLELEREVMGAQRCDYEKPLTCSLSKGEFYGI